MGLNKEAEPSAGRQSLRPANEPLSRRLSWFDQAFQHIGQLGNSNLGRLLEGTGIIGGMALGSAATANADGTQPGVKPESITDTFNSAAEPNQPRIEFGEDGTPTVYVPVEVAGVQSGGDILPSSDGQTEDNIFSAQGGGFASPDAGAVEAPITGEYSSSNGRLIIKQDTGIDLSFPGSLDPMSETYADSGLKFIVVYDPSLRQDYDEYALKMGEPVDRTIMGANICSVNKIDPIQNNAAYKANDCYNPNKTFFLLKPVQIDDKNWELRVKWFPIDGSLSPEAIDSFNLALNRTFIGVPISSAISPDNINSDRARLIRINFEQIMGVTATPPVNNSQSK